jgi:hypothetical protein
LVNRHGEVVGINQSVSSYSIGKLGVPIAGMNKAVPIPALKGFLMLHGLMPVTTPQDTYLKTDVQMADDLGQQHKNMAGAFNLVFQQLLTPKYRKANAELLNGLSLQLAKTLSIPLKASYEQKYEMQLQPYFETDPSRLTPAQREALMPLADELLANSGIQDRLISLGQKNLMDNLSHVINQLLPPSVRVAKKPVMPALLRRLLYQYMGSQGPTLEQTYHVRLDDYRKAGPDKVSAKKREALSKMVQDLMKKKPDLADPLMPSMSEMIKG